MDRRTVLKGIAAGGLALALGSSMSGDKREAAKNVNVRLIVTSIPYDSLNSELWIPNKSELNGQSIDRLVKPVQQMFEHDLGIKLKFEAVPASSYGDLERLLNHKQYPTANPLIDPEDLIKGLPVPVIFLDRPTYVKFMGADKLDYWYKRSEYDPELKGIKETTKRRIDDELRTFAKLSPRQQIERYRETIRAPVPEVLNQDSYREALEKEITFEFIRKHMREIFLSGFHFLGDIYIISNPLSSFETNEDKNYLYGKGSYTLAHELTHRFGEGEHVPLGTLIKDGRLDIMGTPAGLSRISPTFREKVSNGQYGLSDKTKAEIREYLSDKFFGK